jgi:hypothetical protein
MPNSFRYYYFRFYQPLYSENIDKKTKNFNDKFTKLSIYFQISNDFSFLSLLNLDSSEIYSLQGNLVNELKNLLNKRELSIGYKEIDKALKLNHKFKNFHVINFLNWLSQKEFFFKTFISKKFINFFIASDHRNYHLNNFCFNYLLNLDSYIWISFLEIEKLMASDIYFQSNLFSKILLCLKSKIFSTCIFQFISQENFANCKRDYWKFINFFLKVSKTEYSTMILIEGIIKKTYR